MEQETDRRIGGGVLFGKTRLANVMLGTDVLTSPITATTTIPCFIRHINDRPDFQTEQVWIMDAKFKPQDWRNKKECDQGRIIAGGFDTLKDYGTKKDPLDSASKRIVDLDRGNRMCTGLP